MPDPIFSKRDDPDGAYRLSEELNKMGVGDQEVVIPIASGPVGDIVTFPIYRESMPTGLYTGGEVNIVGGGLSVEVETGIGAVIDSYTNPDQRPVAKVLTWPNLTKVITTPTSNLIAWIMLKESSAGGGTAEIIELVTRPTPHDQRDYIYIGLVSWDGAAWNDVSTPIVANNTAHQFYEMIKDIVPPLRFVEGGHISEEAGYTMAIDASIIWEVNRNHHIDQKNPNQQTFGPINPITFRYVTHDFSAVGLVTSLVTSTAWENPLGTVDPTIGGGANTSTIQRLWLDQADNFWITLGQNTYPSFNEARASIDKDTGDSVFSAYLTRDCILLGYIVATRTSSSWVAGSSEFIPFVSGFIGGGGGAPIATFLGLNDTPLDYIGFGGDWPRVNDGETALEFSDKPAEWKGNWMAGEYRPNDMVRDGEWLMIANTVTTDRPSPQPTGDPTFLYPGTIGSDSATAKQVLFGMRYTFGVSGYLQGYRVWTVIGNTYTIYSVLDPLGSPIINQLITFTANVAGWVEFSVPQTIVQAGTVYDLAAIVAEPDPTPTTFNGDWDYLTPQNVGVPVAGEIIHARGQPDTFRIHKTDDNGGDRSVELGTLTVGDIIDGAGVRWAIQTITDNGTWLAFSVSPAVVGVAGIQNFIFETVVATPITYAEDLDFWLGDASRRGLLGIDTDYSLVVPDDSQYGIDLKVQAATVSSDWDPMAFSSGGGGGGGGAATEFFTELLDTPADYVGHASKDVKVKADETGLEFVTPSAASTFDALTDTPASKAGQANRIVAVNAGETALEYIVAPTGGGTLFGPTIDVPGSAWDALDADDSKIFRCSGQGFNVILDLDQITATNWTAQIVNEVRFFRLFSGTPTRYLIWDSQKYIINNVIVDLPQNTAGILTKISADTFALTLAPVIGAVGGDGLSFIETLAVWINNSEEVIDGTNFQWFDIAGATVTFTGLDAGKTYEIASQFHFVLWRTSGTNRDVACTMLMNGLTPSMVDDYPIHNINSYDELTNISRGRVTGVTSCIVKARYSNFSGDGHCRVKHKNMNVRLYEVTNP